MKYFILFLTIGALLFACTSEEEDAETTVVGTTTTVRGEDATELTTASAHPDPDGTTAVTETVDTVQTYSVAFIIFRHSSLDANGTVALRNVAKVEKIKDHLAGQFTNSTYGKGALDLSSDVYSISVDSPFYDVTQSTDMVSWAQQVISEQFYSEQSDDYDFLAIYTDYSADLLFGSRHIEVTPTIAGLSRQGFASSASAWGSAGNLKGVGLIRDANLLPADYDFGNSYMHLLLHEVFGHHWGVFIPHTSDAGAHFHYGVESPFFTVMYGRPWTQDGSNLTASSTIDPSTGFEKVVFHPWILYHAGLFSKSEISEDLNIYSLDQAPQSRYDTYSTTGSIDQTLNIDDLIDEWGDREDL